MRVSLIGYGKTTRAIAKILGGGQIFFDDNVKKSFVDKDKNSIFPSKEFNPNRSDIEILTPSIKPNHHILKVAKNPISEYDLFLGEPEKIGTVNSHLEKLYNPHSKTIWISGTNGKTTTTQMLAYILKNRGAVSGGNIGTPLAELDKKAPLWILETSSYTLHHTKFASPDIYLLLPITPDHLSWHGSNKNYVKDKLKPLTLMKEGELALVPEGFDLPDSKAWVVKYQDNHYLEEFFGLDSSKLRYRAGFLQDALIALATEMVLFDSANYSLMNSFNLDRHRQEEIKDSYGRLWINDSKATNIDATIQAIESYKDRKIHLILGGDDKGIDMEPLVKKISNLNTEIFLYTIGSNSLKLAELAKKFGVKVHQSNYLKEAVEEIDKRLKIDEVALLSPSASSLDQFNSYIERGDKFIEFVKMV